MERFAGKVAVVTGASGGMGSAIVKELLTLSINVVGLDINTGKLKTLEDEILNKTSSYTGKFFPKKCDVSNDEEVKNSFKWIRENLKAVSILINTAGVFIPQGQEVLNMEVQTFDSTLGVNSKGTFLCCREAANSMIENSEPGHIINISSISGYDKHYMPNTCVYAASKHTVRVLTNSLKREILRKRANIKVTLFSPGATRTEIAPVFDGKPREEVLEPEDIANACISILSTPQYVSISEYIIEPLYEAHFDEEKYSPNRFDDEFKSC